MCSGPVEQLAPTANAPIDVSTLAAVAASVPVGVTNVSSNVIVITTGRPVASRAARSAAFASFRSDIVSIRRKSTPDSARTSAWARNESYASQNPRSPSGSTSRPVGPMSPATSVPSPAASRASLAPAAFSSAALSASPAAPSLMEVPPKVLVQMTSATDA